MDLMQTQCLVIAILYLVYFSCADPIRIYMFDKCGEAKNMENEESFQLRILGNEFPVGILNCSMTFKRLKQDKGYVYYKVTNYTVTSTDVRLAINKKERNVYHEDLFGVIPVPSLDQEYKSQKQLSVSISRRNVHATSKFIIYIHIYVKVNTELTPTLLERIGGLVFAIVVLVMMGYGFHRVSKRHSRPGCPEIPSCIRCLTRHFRMCLSNLCRSRPSHVQTDRGPIPRPSISTPDYNSHRPDNDDQSVTDIGFDRDDSLRISARSLSDIESFVNISNLTDISPDAIVRSFPRQTISRIGEEEEGRSVTRSADNFSIASTGSNFYSPSWIELSSLGTLLNRSDDTNSQNSQIRADGPPTYAECVTSPPPPSYNEAVSGTIN